MRRKCRSYNSNPNIKYRIIIEEIHGDRYAQHIHRSEQSGLFFAESDRVPVPETKDLLSQYLVAVENALENIGYSYDEIRSAMREYAANFEQDNIKPGSDISGQ